VLLQLFSQRLLVSEVLVSAGIGGVLSSLGGAMRTYRHSSAFTAYPGGVAVRQTPEPEPTGGDQGELSASSVRPLRRPSARRRGEVSTTPSSGLRIAGSSLSC
jgi:hypothetical protein